MANAYTHVLYEGDQTFGEFAMKCAEAFAPPDQPASQGVPGRHKARILELTAERLTILGLTEEACSDAAKAARLEYDRTYAADATEISRRRARYKDMAYKVRSWQVEPELVPLKELMLEQINGAEALDCSLPNYRPPVQSGTQYRSERLQQIDRELSVQTEAHVAATRIFLARQSWMNALRVAVSLHD